MYMPNDYDLNINKLGRTHFGPDSQFWNTFPIGTKFISKKFA
jgi:hypothetical protein